MSEIEKKLLREMDEMQQLLAAVRRERDQLLTEIAAARERSVASAHDADMFKSRLDEALRQLRQRENDLRDQRGLLSNRAESVNRDVAELQERCRSLGDQLKKEREEFLRQEQDLLRISEQNRQRAEEDRRERSRLEQEMVQLRHESVAARATVEDLNKSVQDGDEARIEQEKLNAALEKRLQGAAEEKARLLQEMEARREEARRALEELRGELAEERLDAQELKKKLGGESKQRADLESRLEEERSQTRHMQEDFANREKQLLSREEQARESSRRYQTMLLSARHELSALQVNFERLERRHLKTAQEYKSDRLELLAEMEQLHKKLATAGDRIRDLEKQQGIERRLAANQVDQIRAQLRSAISLAEREKIAMRAELERLQERAAEVEARAAGFDAEIATLQTAHDSRMTELSAELDRKLQALRKMSGAFEDESRRNRVLEDQILSVRRLLDDMEQKLRHEQAEARKAEKYAQKVREDASEQLREQEGLLAAAAQEREELQTALQTAAQRETSLRNALKSLHADQEELRASVSESVAGRAYMAEKMEAVEGALNQTRSILRAERSAREELEERLNRERENFTLLETQLNQNHGAEREKLEQTRTHEVAALREEIETLTAERDQARKESAEERARNQELLQNLLSMRDELEMAQDASMATKAFFKEKLRQAEEGLQQLQAKFTQEEKRRNELEQQLRDLRRKMEFA